jgi:hypothetical protein
MAGACLLCFGCAIDGTPGAVVTSMRTNVLTAERTSNAIVIGKSTKAYVLAALGQTLAIRFDTGYEVWVYRLADAPAPRVSSARSDNAWPPAPAEFVILFAPSGVVAKTRVRPASS